MRDSCVVIVRSEPVESDRHVSYSHPASVPVFSALRLAARAEDRWLGWWNGDPRMREVRGSIAGYTPVIQWVQDFPPPSARLLLGEMLVNGSLTPRIV